MLVQIEDKKLTTLLRVQIVSYHELIRQQIYCGSRQFMRQQQVLKENPELELSHSMIINSSKGGRDSTQSTQFKKIIKELQERLEKQCKRRQQAEQTFHLYKNRAYVREKQFRYILENVSPPIKQFMKSHEAFKEEVQEPVDSETSKKEINKIYRQVLNSLREANEATTNFIQHQYEDSIAMMHRRIHDIMEQFQVQLSKNKTLSEQSYQKIWREIQKALKIAQTIEDDNLKLKELNDQLKVKNRIINEEKQLLISEVFCKKNCVSKLYQELSYWKKKAAFNLNITTNTEQNSGKDRPFKSPETHRTNTKNLESFNFFRDRPSISSSRRRNSVISHKESDIVSQFTCKDIAKKSCSSKRNKINFNTKIDSNRTNRGVTPQNVLNHTQNSDYRTEGLSKTIFHLQTSLRRQKKKVGELSKTLTEIRRRNSQINDALTQVFEKANNRCRSTQKSLNQLLQYQKLLQVIKNLQKRLLASESPALACGWGQFSSADYNLENEDDFH